MHAADLRMFLNFTALLSSASNIDRYCIRFQQCSISWYDWINHLQYDHSLKHQLNQESLTTQEPKKHAVSHFAIFFFFRCYSTLFSSHSLYHNYYTDEVLWSTIFSLNDNENLNFDIMAVKYITNINHPYNDWTIHQLTAKLRNYKTRQSPGAKNDQLQTANPCIKTHSMPTSSD